MPEEYKYDLPSRSPSVDNVQARDLPDIHKRAKGGDELKGLLKPKQRAKNAANQVWRRKQVEISNVPLGPTGMRTLRSRLSRMGGESRQSVRNRKLAKRRDQRITDAAVRVSADQEAFADGNVPKARHERYGIAQQGKSKYVKVRTNFQRTVLQRDREVLLSDFKKCAKEDYIQDVILHDFYLDAIDKPKIIWNKQNKRKKEDELKKDINVNIKDHKSNKNNIIDNNIELKNNEEPEKDWEYIIKKKYYDDLSELENNEVSSKIKYEKLKGELKEFDKRIKLENLGNNDVKIDPEVERQRENLQGNLNAAKLEYSEAKENLKNFRRATKLEDIEANFIKTKSKIITLAEELTDVVDLQIARITNAKELDPKFDDHGKLRQLEDAHKKLETFLGAMLNAQKGSKTRTFPSADQLDDIADSLDEVFGPDELEITKDLGSPEALKEAVVSSTVAEKRQIRLDRELIGKSLVVEMKKRGDNEVFDELPPLQPGPNAPAPHLYPNDKWLAPEIPRPKSKSPESVSVQSRRSRYEADLSKALNSHGLSSKFEADAIKYKHETVVGLVKSISESGIQAFKNGNRPANLDALRHHNDRLLYYRHRERLCDRYEKGVSKAKSLANRIDTTETDIENAEAALKKSRQVIEETRVPLANAPIGVQRPGNKNELNKQKFNALNEELNFDESKLDVPTSDHVTKISLEVKDALKKRKYDIARRKIAELEDIVEVLEKTIAPQKKDLVQQKEEFLKTVSEVASNSARLVQLDKSPQAVSIAANFANDADNPPSLADVTAEFNAALEAVRQDVRAYAPTNNKSPEARAIQAALKKARACVIGDHNPALGGQGETHITVSMAEADGVISKWKIEVDLEHRLRDLQRLGRDVTRARKEYRDRFILSAWKSKLTYWLFRSGAYHRLAKANDALKSARSALFDRMSASMHFDGAREREKAFDDFVKYGFIGGSAGTENNLPADAIGDGGLRTALNLLDRAEEVSHATSEVVEVILRSHDAGSSWRDVFHESEKDILHGILETAEYAEHGIGAISNTMSAYSAYKKIQRVKDKKRIGLELTSKFSEALQKRKDSPVERERLEVRNGISRMLGWRLSDQNTYALKTELVAETGHASRQVVADIALGIATKASHAATVTTGVAVGAAAVFEAAETLSDAIEAGKGRLESNKLEKKYEEKKLAFVNKHLWEYKGEHLGAHISEERRFLSKLTGIKFGPPKNWPETHEELTGLVKGILKTKHDLIRALERDGDDINEIRRVRDEAQKLHAAFADLANFHEFIATLRARKKVKEKLLVVAKGAVATGGYTTACIVGLSASSAAAGPVGAAIALGVAGIGSVGVKVYRSHKATKREQRAQMADRALMDMAHPGTIAKIKKEAKIRLVSEETIALEMLTQKDPEYRAELLLADLQQEAGHVRMTDDQIEQKALLGHHLQMKIDLTNELVAWRAAAEDAERKYQDELGSFGSLAPGFAEAKLDEMKQNEVKRSEVKLDEVTLDDVTLDEAKRNEVKQDIKIEAKLAAEAELNRWRELRERRYAADLALRKIDWLEAKFLDLDANPPTIEDPDDPTQQISLEVVVDSMLNRRTNLFNEESPDHSKTALILRDVVGMSQAEILAMIDAGETRYDENAAALSHALILSHLDEK